MLGDLFSLPFRVLKIPANLAAEICAEIDPNDDLAIQSAARSVARMLNCPLDAAERAVRAALEDE